KRVKPGRCSTSCATGAKGAIRSSSCSSVCRLARDVGEEEFDGGEVALLGLEQEDDGDVLDVLGRHLVYQRRPQCGHLLCERVATASGVAPREPALVIPAALLWCAHRLSRLCCCRDSAIVARQGRISKSNLSANRGFLRPACRAATSAGGSPRMV